jgi:hypothetical protein
MHQARVDLSKIRINRSPGPKPPESVRSTSQAREGDENSIFGSLAAGLAAIGDRFTAPRRQFRIP